MNVLRMYILVNRQKELPAWEVKMLKEMVAAGLVTLKGFIVSDEMQTQKENLALQLFRKFENKWFRSLPDAFEKFLVSSEFAQLPFIEICDTSSGKLPEADLVYCSCMAGVDHSLLKQCRYGIWQIEFGTVNRHYRYPLAYWEVMSGIPCIGSRLVVHMAHRQHPVIVYNGNTVTVPFSVKNTLITLAWKSSSYLLGRLQEFSATDADSFFEYYAVKYPQVQENGDTRYHPPALLTAAHFVRNLWRYLQYKLRMVFTKQRFRLLYARKAFDLLNITINDFTAIPLPDNCFWADPFPVKKGDSVFVFFEDYPYAVKKGHISVMEIKSDGSCSKPAVAIEKPYHLSYPFIFEYEENYYMIPETADNKTVELYKCISFPHCWEIAEVLMKDIVLIDATLLYYNNKWWLFGTAGAHETASSNDQLVIFYSDSLFSGNWKPHRQNPVVTDVANCRPGGRIFQFNGKLYRPAQNNASMQYGYALQLNEIETLTESAYSEKPVKAFIPGKENGLKAVHTFNFTEDFIVIDGILS
jgi:hypothetical protein